ncbi:transmembrane protein 245 isoform X2 [Parasteatoda tepidariorum]|uniref:transmembrane protein 245 isoform X2 n=1 Tax=Parasteatoda tepidariorum TaxID=114398 RepID=UPI00077FC966|nr:transmembrane protein 245 isoform X2 [Parasteatoda tepidariorum]
MMATDVSRSFKFDISTILPEGHEKAFKQAFYNVAAIVFVLFIIVACVAVYYVLEPFLRPLLWAVLFGSVLHPFKHRMTVILKSWILKLQLSGTPLTIGTFTAPFIVIDHISENLWEFTLQYIVIFATIVSCIFVSFLLYSCVPLHVISSILNTLSFVLNGVSSMLEFCQGASFLVWSVLIGYVIILSVWWTPSTKPYLIFFSPVIWTIFICHLVNVAGSLRLTILLIFFALMLIGLMADIKSRYSETGYSEDSTGMLESNPRTPMQAIKSGIAWIRGTEEQSPELSSSIVRGTQAEEIDNSTPSQKVQVDSSTPERKRPTSLPSTFMDEIPSEEKMSNFYIYGLLWMCFVIQLYRHMSLCYLMLIPCIYMGIKHAAIKFGLMSFLKEKFRNVYANCCSTFEQRKDALIPAPLRGLWRLLILGDKKFLILLEGSIDTFTSMMAIFLVFFFAVIGTIFLCVQIYGESMHLVTVTSSLINRTVHNTDIQQLVPESLRDVQGTVDAVLDDAFLYGRGWISATVRKGKKGSQPVEGKVHFSSLVRRIIDDKNEERAAELEKQILEIFDKVYELWHSRNENSTSPNFEHVASFDSLVDGFKTLNMDLIVNFVKENIGTFLSVLESVWLILKGNITLAFSAITAIISLLFGGGTAVLNFVLNFVVFSTSLFYLLCASGNQYKPVEACSNLLPTVGSGAQFGRAVEEAINGVFAASFKMAAFYGLYTWFIHTLFDVKIVYIPSVLAAILGAVPFLGAYWACLPAVLELWLVNGQIITAVVMLVVQLVPTSFVDSAVYSEIKGGGHPYLTGLAIAGGVFCLGFEGALFGPMLLCVLYVAMHMYGAVIKPGSMDESRRMSKAFSLKRMFTIE